MMEHLVSAGSGVRRRRRRIGRGNGSGRGTYSGKGLKGQKSRSGGGPKPGFEGGQLPLQKRLPEKRGFTNIFKKDYALVKIGALSLFTDTDPITPESLLQKGLLKNLKFPVKILGDGEITQALTICAHKFSASARSKIESVGGQVKELSL